MASRTTYLLGILSARQGPWKRRDPSAISERRCLTGLDFKSLDRLLGQRSDDPVKVAAVSAGRFLPIVPDFVPMPHAVVLVTGLCEIAGSVALLTRRLRRLAGVMLAIYAVCVFPANIKHTVEGIPVPPLPDSWWYHGPRLIMQPVLVWWALFCAEVIDWPRQRHPTP